MIEAVYVAFLAFVIYDAASSDCKHNRAGSAFYFWLTLIFLIVNIGVTLWGYLK